MPGRWFVVDRDLERQADRLAGQDETRPERDLLPIRVAPGWPLLTVARRRLAGLAGHERHRPSSVAEPGLSSLRQRPIAEPGVCQTGESSGSTREPYGHPVSGLHEQRELVAPELADDARGRVRGGDEDQRSHDQIASVGERPGEVCLGPPRAVHDHTAGVLQLRRGCGLNPYDRLCSSRRVGTARREQGHRNGRRCRRAHYRRCPSSGHAPTVRSRSPRGSCLGPIALSRPPARGAGSR